MKANVKKTPLNLYDYIHGWVVDESACKSLIIDDERMELDLNYLRHLRDVQNFIDGSFKNFCIEQLGFDGINRADILDNGKIKFSDSLLEALMIVVMGSISYSNDIYRLIYKGASISECNFTKSAIKSSRSKLLDVKFIEDLFKYQDNFVYKDYRGSKAVQKYFSQSDELKSVRIIDLVLIRFMIISSVSSESLTKNLIECKNRNDYNSFILRFYYFFINHMLYNPKTNIIRTFDYKYLTDDDKDNAAYEFYDMMMQSKVMYKQNLIMLVRFVIVSYCKVNGYTLDQNLSNEILENYLNNENDIADLQVSVNDEIYNYRKELSQLSKDNEELTKMVIKLKNEIIELTNKKRLENKTIVVIGDTSRKKLYEDIIVNTYKAKFTFIDGFDDKNTKLSTDVMNNADYIIQLTAYMSHNASQKIAATNNKHKVININSCGIKSFIDALEGLINEK
jgi:hypothetical protein